MNQRLTRVLRDEDGFTLAEMMVTMMIMLLVLFALYSIFDMSIRVFGFGNDKVEAVENARLGLEKMEREIRAAYLVNGSAPAKSYLFFNANGSSSNPPKAMPAADQITFGNDLGATGDGKIECPNPQGRCEYITYKLTSTADSAKKCSEATAPCELRRVNTKDSSNSGDPVVEFVKPGGLTFTYFKDDGTVPKSESEIARVRVQLQTEM
jgi:prepilin-type N-terminal cleavage/methylation domain-containing protein